MPATNNNANASTYTEDRIMGADRATLRKWCKNHGVTQAGTKADMQARLLAKIEETATNIAAAPTSRRKAKTTTAAPVALAALESLILNGGKPAPKPASAPKVEPQPEPMAQDDEPTPCNDPEGLFDDDEPETAAITETKVKRGPKMDDAAVIAWCEGVIGDGHSKAANSLLKTFRVAGNSCAGRRFRALAKVAVSNMA